MRLNFEKAVRGWLIFTNFENTTFEGENMGSVGKPTASTAFKQAMSNAENSIRSNAVESAILLDSDGTVLFDKSENNVSAVHFTNEETARMADKSLTHNHPSGTTFSVDDINLLFKTGLKEIRACHTNGYYSLVRDFEIGGAMPLNAPYFAIDYYTAKEQYAKRVVDPIFYSGARTKENIDKCNKMIDDFRSDWLKKHASEYGYTYKEGKLNE